MRKCRLPMDLCVHGRFCACPRVFAAALGAAVVLACTAVRAAESVPIRVLMPEGAGGGVKLPAGGGIPFPKGALRSVSNVLITGAGGKEIPAQVTRTAVWPDGSVKWVFVDLILPAGRQREFKLVYGRGVRRKPVRDGIKAEKTAGGVRVTGGGVSAFIDTGGGVVDELSFSISEGGAARRRRTVFTRGRGARLIVEMLRVEEARTGEVLPVRRFVSNGASKGIQRGRVQVDSVSVEAPGPIRATVLVRGHVLLPDLGKTLPDRVKQREPAGRLPFSMRLSFYRGLPLVFGQHQVVYTGEPDCDFIARWAIELPGLGSSDIAGSLVLEPGVELASRKGKLSPAEKPHRLLWAPLAGGGFALIRHGWENRPCAVTHEGKNAYIDFWPVEAGCWDLRRYAREWAVGETGRRENPGDMLRYAKYAARGLAKSHDFVICLDRREPDTALVKAYADRTVLTAPPGWIAASEALGPYAPEQASGLTAEFDAAIRRTIDYYLFNQDLYRWHGKLEYGLWQTRSGNIHRNDRWERDYGRWGWALGDGAGRISQVLMLEYVRTLERRYLKAGEAYCRAIYDTNMVHTVQHLENASANWWTVAGCCHRHNVQPFGCPYIGMRGSHPVGAKILYFVTGDGVIRDGLDLVTDASVHYLTDQPGRFGCSGGSDGQGSGANALLFAHETTGDERYLELCRKMLDKSGLIPPGGKSLGYGPDFGLFNAAAEYADLTGDDALRRRFIETARAGLGHKNKRRFLYTFAMADRMGGGEEFAVAIRAEVPALRKKLSGGLTELPPAQWPGHGGRLNADPRANLFRDLPYVLPALGARTSSPGAWPKPRPFPTAWPPKVPDGWSRPGGKQSAGETVLRADRLLGSGRTRRPKRPLEFKELQAAGGKALRGAVLPFVRIARARGSDPRDAVSVRDTRPSLAGEAAARVTRVLVEGAKACRVQMAMKIPKGKGLVTSWGLRLPLALGADKKKIQLHAPGAFRVERWRVDQNDEQIPNWLTSDTQARWPLWRVAGISLGPAGSYRIWRANRRDTSPLYTDQGFGSAGWLDVSDRGEGFGVTVRLLKSDGEMSRQAVEVDLESGVLEVQFHDVGAPSLVVAGSGLSGACDIIFHDGWRPPLRTSGLTRAQFAKLLSDLDYGGNHGLFALRLRLAKDHRIPGPWVERILDSGVEPRELLRGMLWRDALPRFCRKIGVPYDADNIDATITRVVERYRR